MIRTSRGGPAAATRPASPAHRDAVARQQRLRLARPRTRRSGRCSRRAPRRRRRSGCRPTGAAARRRRRRRSPARGTASATARVSARSKPLRVPSRSMLVSRISPAPAAGHAPRPVDRVEPGVAPAAVGVDVPAGQRRRRAAWRRSRRRCTARRTSPTRRGSPAGSATAAELKLTLSAPALSSRRTSATRAHAAADGERDEHLRRHRLDDVQDQVAAVAGGGDVEEGQLVGALLVVARRDLDRVAGVAQLDEVDALDDAAAR